MTDAAEPPRLTIVLPVYNEGEPFEPVLRASTPRSGRPAGQAIRASCWMINYALASGGAAIL